MKQRIRTLNISMERLLAWLLMGSVISLSLAAMCIAGKINLSCFYDVGQIYDVQQDKSTAVEGAVYQEKTELYTVTKNRAARRFAVYDEGIKWKNMYVHAKLVGKESVPVKVQLCNEDGKVLRTIKYEMKNGANIIPLKKQKFFLGYIVLENQKGSKFVFEDIRLFEKEAVFFVPNGFLYTLVFFVIYAIVSGILWKIFREKIDKWNWYVVIEDMQGIFCIFGNRFAENKQIASSVAQYGGRIRTVMFALLFGYTYIVWEKGLLLPYFKYHAFVCTAILVMIAIFSIEHQLEKLDWKHSLILYWLLTCTCAILSDFIVEKTHYIFIGWIILLITGFTSFVWGNMKHPYMIIKNIMDAMEILFWLNAACCMLFRPYISGIRYSGTASHPVMYAMYMAVMIIMFIAKMENECKGEKLDAVRIRYVVGLTMAMSMLWMTQSLTGAGTILFLGVLYFIRFRNAKMKRAKGILLIMLVTLVLWTWGMNYVCSFLNLENIFPCGTVYAKQIDNPWIETVFAAEGQSRLWNKVFNFADMDTLTSGRTLYWLEYLRDMNLWGHPYKASFWGDVRWPHNGVLWIAYYYGVFTCVPYMMMIGLAIKEALKRVSKNEVKGKYEIAVCGLLLCINIISLMDNVERPFGSLVWYLLYLLIGYLFTNEEENGIGG